MHLSTQIETSSFVGFIMNMNHYHLVLHKNAEIKKWRDLFSKNSLEGYNLIDVFYISGMNTKLTFPE